jgi:uncharacterized protein (TIGR02145 family)
MKSIISIISLLISTVTFSQLGIGTITPDLSSQLDLTSESKGLLPPRMSFAQRNAVATPVAGLIIWCADCGYQGEMQAYNGTIWTNLCGATAYGIVPNPPTNPIATEGDNQASIAFTAPVFTGSSPITSYTVTALPGGFTNTGATSPIVVSGLIPNTYYSFTVVANSAAGISLPSEPTSVILAGTRRAICDETVPTTIVEITSTTGKVWMDRNLGASRPGISATDYKAFGCLYQWGRGNDGHASINWTSATTGTPVYGSFTTVTSSNTPGHAVFIRGTSATNFDWRSPKNDALWQGVNLVNNPCPTSFHVPSGAEFYNELIAYGISNTATAYTNGPNGGFKFVDKGFRQFGDASILKDTNSYYWTTNLNGANVYYRNFKSSETNSFSTVRTMGFSVRCVRD